MLIESAPDTRKVLHELSNGGEVFLNSVFETLWHNDGQVSRMLKVTGSVNARKSIYLKLFSLEDNQDVGMIDCKDINDGRLLK